MPRYIFTLILVSLLCLKSFGQDVYKTPSGKKYHLASCRMVKNVSEKISLEKAIEIGLEPCKICNPPASIANESSKQPQGSGVSVQCMGTTKNGTRCKHMTRIANGYCYQHQPKK